MSFTFKWPRFSDQFHADAIQMLNSALNKGNKPPVIADKIEVVELEMGTQPPELEIRDIGELTLDQFRGIFRLTYSGDAHLVLRTKVQANPLNHKQPDIHLMAGSRGMLAAKQPLVVPMLLRLSHFKLSSYVVLVVSKQKGITLVFKTDPLQNVDINSTFDSIAVIQKYIQREIEGQLRQMFREDLPGIIHRLSQQWVKAKVEAPYLAKRPKAQSLDAMSLPSIPRYPRSASVGMASSVLRRQAVGIPSLVRPRSPSNSSIASTTRETPPSVVSSPSVQIKSPSHDSPTSFPDIENFDPTYGLRPEGLPTKSLFSGFGRLFAPNKGLAALAEDAMEDELDEVGSGSFDVVEWEDTIPDYSPPPSVTEDDPTEYETIPAIGGGVITRPRVFHSQSQVQSGSGMPNLRASTSSLPPRSGRRTPSLASTSRMMQSTPSLPLSTRHLRALQASNGLHDIRATPASGRTYGMLGLSVEPQEFPWYQESDDHFHYSASQGTSLRPPLSRPMSPESNMSQSAADPHANVDGIPIRKPSERRSSVSSSNFDGFHSGSPPMYHPIHEHDPKIILRPTLNNSISQLSTLSQSNHTLSPYTRSLEHFTVRSVPRRQTGLSGSAAAAERQPTKAKRKRTHRLGGKKRPDNVTDNPSLIVTPSSPTPPSEFDESDMDHYFRSREETHSRYTTNSPHSPLDASFPYRRHSHQSVQRTTPL